VARRSRRGGGAPDARVRDEPARTLERLEQWRGEDWLVRPITGSASTKSYRCPGCDHEIRPATPHVVAWPADAGEGLEGRRHWHTACWRARERRGPR
jgi:hypothetical protein